MQPGHVAGALGRGMVAGLAGTAAMTAWQMAEMKLTDREPSTAPADAVEKVLGVTYEDEEARQRTAQLVHWGYGTDWGMARGLLSAAGLGPVTATAAHFVAVWGAALGMLPALGLAPPPTEWGGKQLGKDALMHLVYAVTTGLVFEYLERHDGLA